MRRIRIVFALITLVLAVPVALIVYRAHTAIEAERDARHLAVAERVFDEMERELTQLLQREEERPPGHYRFYHVPARMAEGSYAVARSPLALRPDAGYVVGYFQIDPEGRLTSPLVPFDTEFAERNGDWQPSPEVEAVVSEVERIVEQAIPTRLEVLELLATGAASGAETRIVDADAAFSSLIAAAEREGLGGESEVDAYRALNSLNRGAAERVGQPRQRIEVRVSRSEGPNRLLLSASVGRDPEPAHGEAMPNAPEGALLRGQTAVVHPMLASVVGEHLVLYRSVLLGDAAYRQGLVLDASALSRFLYTKVLRGSELARHAAFDFYLIPEKPRVRDPKELARARVYDHFFAQPFHALALRMLLPSLPDGGGGGYLNTLIVLLISAAVIGLFALFRMVVVTVRFAERRSNFAAAVSHELKTPLTAIRMYAEMLRDGMVASEEKQKEYYATITAESERLTRLINNVLEFSRLEQGTREMSLVSARLAPAVEEAARILEPHAKSAGFEIRVEIEENLPAVRFDRDAVLQVVFNLVDNALKYARDSSDRVVVLQCGRKDDAVVLSVRDRGPGVPARHLSKIFEAFYRGESELTRRAKGTGIGLALVKGLAERMGAAVSGRNAASGGFEVSLTFRASG